jgi:hypothetical protein
MGKLVCLLCVNDGKACVTVVWERAVACLVGVQPPVLQLLLEERAAHVRRIVQLSRPVVVQDLSEHARMPETC